MASEPWRITIDDSALRVKLARLESKMANMKPFFEVVGRTLVESIGTNFEVGGRYKAVDNWRGGSKKWQPLAISTLFAGKKSKFVTKSGRFRKGKSGAEASLKGRRILVQSAVLEKSINSQADSGGVEVGSNLPYAAIHNFGGKAGPGRKVTIPARPFFVVQDEDIDEINATLEDFLMGVN